MEIAKEYIIQCIKCASNNLRLSSEKIEVVAILKEHLCESNNLSDTILEMKKITKFSKFGIKLSEVNRYISNGNVDFLVISDKFKEHTHFILRELSNLLDLLTPTESRELLFGSKKSIVEKKSEEIKEESFEKVIPDLNIQIIKNEMTNNSYEVNQKSESDILKEEIILGDIKTNDELTFESFEKEILRPVNELDSFLKKLLLFEHNIDDLILNTEMMYEHAELSEKIGFALITNMHLIFADTLSLIKENKLMPDEKIIESLRACLIVIAAVVRSKDVDITNYLNSAELLERKIKNMK